MFTCILDVFVAHLNSSGAPTVSPVKPPIVNMLTFLLDLMFKAMSEAPKLEATIDPSGFAIENVLVTVTLEACIVLFMGK